MVVPIEEYDEIERLQECVDRLRFALAKAYGELLGVTGAAIARETIREALSQGKAHR